MTAETDLLPLPEWDEAGPALRVYTESTAQAYARACVSSSNEALRAEVESVQMQLGDETRTADYWKARAETLQEQLDWTVRQNDELLNEGRELTARAETLRAKAAEHRDGRLAALEQTERLAEALREIAHAEEGDSLIGQIARAALEQEPAT